MAVTFGVVLAASAFLASRPRRPQDRPQQPDPLATRLRLDGSYPGPNVAGTRRVPEPPTACAAYEMVDYHVRGVPGGFGLMFIAGGLSGLLGIGSGALKVLAMDQVMRHALQGLDDNQQFHDRRDGGGQRAACISTAAT